jgi:hypothetical protein
MLGNGIMAIASGLVGSWLVQGLGLGPVAPFDAAIVVLLAGGAIVAATWEENRGSSGEGSVSLARQFQAAALTIARGRCPPRRPCRERPRIGAAPGHGPCRPRVQHPIPPPSTDEARHPPPTPRRQARRPAGCDAGAV